MAIPLWLDASPAGMLVAIACVVAGGPWFADGLHVVRLRRLLGGLSGDGEEALHSGTHVTHGRVVLESPLFGPLSGRPCAGFVLEVRSPDGPFAARLEECRPFLLETRDGCAEVSGRATRWHLAATQERVVGSPAELTANLMVLMERSAELRWLKARGGPLVLVERSLPMSAQASVLGCVEHASVAESWVEPELARTGTDDVVASVRDDVTPEWRIGAGGALEACVVSDRALEPAHLAPPAWRAIGAVLGPALGLAGLLQLAHAAAPLVGGTP